MTVYADLNSRVRRLGPPSLAGAPLVDVARAIAQHHRNLDESARSLCHELASYLALSEYGAARTTLRKLEVSIEALTEATNRAAAPALTGITVMAQKLV